MSELYNQFHEVTSDNLKKYLDRYVRAGHISGDTRDGYTALFCEKFEGKAVSAREFEEFQKELAYQDNAHHITKGDAGKISGFLREA